MKKMMLSSFGLIDRVGRSINVENREILLKFHFRCQQLLFCGNRAVTWSLASPFSSHNTEQFMAHA